MDTPEAHIQQGWAMIDARQHAVAAECFGRALALSPRSGAALGGLAIALRGAGRTSQSIKAAREGVAAAPGVAWNHYVLGWTLSAGGHHRRAIVNLNRAIEMAPWDAHAWSERASCYYAIGEYHNAQRDAEEAARLDPNSADALNALGLSLFYAGQRKRGRATLYHCRALHPGDARTHANIGWVAATDMEYAESAESFRRALELRPSETRWVEPLIDSTRKRLLWHTALRGVARHVVTLATVCVFGLACPGALAGAMTGPRSADAVRFFVIAGFAVTATAILTLTGARSAIGRSLACIDPLLRRLTPPAFRDAGVYALALVALQMTVMVWALATESAGLAWLSVLPLLALTALCATQHSPELRPLVEVAAGAAALAWTVYGLAHEPTRLWTAGGLLLLGFASTRLARLRRRLTPVAGGPSLH